MIVQPSPHNLLELYRAHRDEIDALTDSTSLFILAFVNHIGAARADELARELNLSAARLREKMTPLRRGNFMDETRGALRVTATGKQLLQEIGFGVPPPAEPTEPKPEPEPPRHPTVTPRAAGLNSLLLRGVGVLLIAAVAAIVALFIPFRPAIPTPSEARVTFTTDRYNLKPGECATLHWSVEGGRVEFVELNAQRVGNSGQMQVCPEKTTAYVLVVGAGIRIKRDVLIVVESPPPPEVQIRFTADRTNIRVGECTVLRWSVLGGYGVEIDGKRVERSGEMQVCPKETITFQLAVDIGVAVKRSELVIAVSQPPPLTETHTPTLTRFVTSTPTRTVTPTSTRTVTPTPGDTTPPRAPSPISPSGGMMLSCSAPSTLTWSSVSDPSKISRYDWVLERSTTGSSGPYAVYGSGSTTGTSATPSATCGQWYRWRVRAVDGAGNVGAYSAYAYFSIGID